MFATSFMQPRQMHSISSHLAGGMALSPKPNAASGRRSYRSWHNSQHLPHCGETSETHNLARAVSHWLHNAAFWRCSLHPHTSATVRTSIACCRSQLGDQILLQLAICPPHTVLDFFGFYFGKQSRSVTSQDQAQSIDSRPDLERDGGSALYQ